ncbi:hypothetical protein [Haladaptatus caseinilyticus]|uniref:hypothetical protein n=1 Tax=Haladaptatus caseinilyticus TaxID=2993314 RepID=UPI00224AF52D|nr:hypothetical protein [Haladaptatus caseinilyticus]
MTFGADERGVTVQVGTILLFATLVVAMSLYQATAIPNQTAGIEFRHNERIQGQMNDVRNAVVRTGATGSSQPASVTLGTQYPSRVFFINPPPASGRLETTELGSIRVENVTTRSPETSDYWDSGRTDLSFATRALVYSPNYNQYGNAPDTVMENTVVYNRADEGDAVLAGQQLVRGRSLTLVTLDGSLSDSRAGTTSIDPYALSPSTTVTRTVPVHANGSGNVTIRVPIRLGEEKWKQLLTDQMAPDGYVTDVSVESGILTLTLLETDANGEAITYDLRMAKVGIGSNVVSEKPHYVTGVSGNDTGIVEGGRQRLVAEVRDRYNNPVSGASVNFTLADASRGTTHELGNETTTGQTVRATTGTDGRATVTYHLESVSENGDGIEVRGSIESIPATDGTFDRERKETLAFDVTAVRANGNGGENDGEEPPTEDIIVYQRDGTAVDVDGDGRAAGIRFTVAGKATQSITITDVGIDAQRKLKRLSDPTTNVGKWRSELYVDADEKNGLVDIGGGVDLPATIDIDQDGWYGAYDTEPILSGRGSATFHLFQFQKQNEEQVDMSGRRIDVTVWYELSDGTTGSATVTVTPD